MDEPPLAVATLPLPHKKDLAALGQEGFYHRHWRGKPGHDTVTWGGCTARTGSLLCATTHDGLPRPPYPGCRAAEYGRNSRTAMDDAESQPLTEGGDTPNPERTTTGATRVQSVTCGRCGWPSACVAQDGMRLLTFVCHWCGKTTIGVVDPTIKRTVIF